ncbi:hypothetical protein HC928_06260 [bacterium]|nr:hypothetical protein [bacterium]
MLTLDLSVIGDYLVWHIGDDTGPALVAIRADSPLSFELLKSCLMSLRYEHVVVEFSMLIEQIGELHETRRK